jgi:hypothetical protein
MSQKSEADTSYILLDPTWRTTLKADEEFGEIQIWKLHNTQQYIEEVEMRTWNNEDSNRLDHQYSSL